VIADAAVWQRGYYEHIIRDADDLERIRRYIETNPIRWVQRYSASQREGEAGV